MPNVSPAGKHSLQARLLHEIKEIESDPYPNVIFHSNDSVTEACLILTPDGGCPLHLRMKLADYPLKAPVVTIQSQIDHPNVFDSYICASILNTAEGYTPAYTLKGIAIQLLSFFNSDSLEQDHERHSITLGSYKDGYARALGKFFCKDCAYSEMDIANNIKYNRIGLQSYMKPLPWLPNKIAKTVQSEPREPAGSNLMEIDDNVKPLMTGMLALPDELLLQILKDLRPEQLTVLSQASSRIKATLQSYDFLRLSELKCFVLKESFLSTALGIGVSIVKRGQTGTLSSEFDLVSLKAVEDCSIHNSIHGQRFQCWLPLALSPRHWRRVRRLLPDIFGKMAKEAGLKETNGFGVLSHFLSDIVVKFSQATEHVTPKRHNYGNANNKSTLAHASEKAVEAYFALFHLLLSLAVCNPSIVHTANTMISSFLSTPSATSKSACPNLGILLTATLISSTGLTPTLMRAIIKEAVCRNVVWMLNAHPELAYLEADPISDYRLKMTYMASTTSYNLLMFCSLFARCARPDPSVPLASLRDSLFETHGAPPAGMAEYIASEIRRIKLVDAFPAFMKEVGLGAEGDMPSKSEFTAFLRRMVGESEGKGYHVCRYTPVQLVSMREDKEPGILGRAKTGAAAAGRGERELRVMRGRELGGMNAWSFFPGLKGGGKGEGNGNGNGNGRGARLGMYGAKYGRR
ncbi:uncharacterized protein KY384_004073 [Bacidia gigantensis]|uniref:uncharacterized protein n=1 Tax=Bacidia gigantensis TaxID=2732470 RepID=UPI001D04307D|nr:uncharacterized protein KY384_004073 [Bacidia gigantensis]KAG8530716.1 hypothetical protein KY384_004073 [Bacidia gigantensis]